MLNAPDFTFTRLAQLCLALAEDRQSDDGSDLAVVDDALSLDSFSRESVLEQAVEHGFVRRPGPGIVALAERGLQLSKELQEGIGSAEKKEASFAARSFTTFTPTGNERLG
jgi:hypothetical protein